MAAQIGSDEVKSERWFGKDMPPVRTAAAEAMQPEQRLIGRAAESLVMKLNAVDVDVH